MWRRIASSIGELAWYGAACALLATLISASDGTDVLRDGGLPLLALIGVYAVITVVCGALLGILRPLAASTVSIGLVAAVVALPAMVAVMWFAADRKFSHMGAVDYEIAVALAVIVGPLVAAYSRIREGHGADR